MAYLDADLVALPTDGPQDGRAVIIPRAMAASFVRPASRWVGKGTFEFSLSVPLVLEYEDVLLRHLDATRLTPRDIRDVLDYLCAVGKRQKVYFLWRPHLRDMKDDHVLELAVAAGSEAIVTFNRRDFAGAESFGIRVIGPKEFLSEIEELS